MPKAEFSIDPASAITRMTTMETKPPAMAAEPEDLRAAMILLTAAAVALAVLLAVFADASLLFLTAFADFSAARAVFWALALTL